MSSASTDWFNAGSNPTVQTKCDVELVRNGTTVTVNWTVRMKLSSSGSYLGTGSLDVSCSCSGGGSDSDTIKDHNDRWSGTDEHSVSGSFSFSNSSTSTETFTINFSSESDYFSSSGIFDTSVSCSVNGWAAYATISANVSSRSYKSVTINWSTDVNIDQFQYKIGSGNWIDVEKNVNKRSGSFTIPNLNPNTSYTISLDAKRRDSQQWSTHGGKGKTLNTSTYDIGKISSVSNFNHGDNESLSITNPSGASLTLEMKIGNTQILTKTVVSGNNTIEFTDSQLDAIYRLYGSSNALTATFNLLTNNDSNYKDTKTITISLTGNQKTGHLKVNGSWKRTKRWIKVNGSWKRCVRWIKVNGSWKRCI